MTIKVGDSMPAGGFAVMTENGPDGLDATEYFAGRKVVLFALPGAYTPTCSAQHLPGFIKQADALKAKGVDEIACLSVNDVFVMGAWGKDQGADGAVTMLADGSCAYTQALGLELDLIDRGLGMRSQRYAMVVDDGKVSVLNVEDGGAFEVSSAEAILAAL